MPNQFNNGNDGLEDGPSLAEVMIDGLKTIDAKVDTLILSSGKQESTIESLDIRMLAAEKTIAEHTALKNRAGGVLVVGSMVLGFIGVVFWKFVDILLNSRGINTGS